MSAFRALALTRRYATPAVSPNMRTEVRLMLAPPLPQASTAAYRGVSSGDLRARQCKDEVNRKSGLTCVYIDLEANMRTTPAR